MTQQAAIDRPCLQFPCYGEIRRLRAAAGISFLQTYQVSADFMMNSQSGRRRRLSGETQPLLDSILILCKAAVGRTKSNRRPLDNDLLQTASRGPPRQRSAARRRAAQRQEALTSWSTTWILVCICWRSSLCCCSACSANLGLSKEGTVDFKRTFFFYCHSQPLSSVESKEM